MHWQLSPGRYIQSLEVADGAVGAAEEAVAVLRQAVAAVLTSGNKNTREPLQRPAVERSPSSSDVTPATPSLLCPSSTLWDVRVTPPDPAT